MRKKTVLHLVSNLGIGGAQAVIANTCNEMSTHQDWESIVLPLGSDSSMIPRFHDGIILLRPVMHRTRYYARTIHRVCKILNDIKPDVLHLHLWLPKLIGVQCGVMCGVPAIVSTEHSGFPWTKSFRRSIDRYLSRHIQQRIMVCKYIQNLFVGSGVCAPGQSTVLYNPIPEPRENGENSRSDAKARLGISEDTVVFLFVGSLRKVKNVKRLLESFSLYLTNPQAPQSRLLIVGSGPDLQILTETAKQFGIDEQISFENYQLELNGYLRAADIFAMTSETEGFSIALAEAMQYGVVPICTAVGGTPELIIDGETGFLLDNSNQHSDAEVFLRVAKSSDLRNKIGLKAQEYVKNLTCTSSYVTELTQIYDRYINSVD